MGAGIILFYIILCLLVAWGYSDTAWGFGAGFIISLLLSPVIGLIIMLFAPDKRDNTIQNQILLSQQQIMQHQLNQQANSKPQISLQDELTKLENLREKKLITEEEYSKMRDKIMKSFL
jgi:hypothetical protein